MRIDVTRPLKNFNGQVLAERDASGVERPITLRDLCCAALTNATPGETLQGTEKMRRFTLAQRIYTDDVAELLADDIVLLKKIIDTLYNVVIVGAAWTALEEGETSAPAAPAAKRGK